MSGEGVVAADLRKRADWLSAAVVLGHAALVFGPLFVVVSLPPGVSWLLCYLWFGTMVHGLLNLMHECAHFHVFTSRAGSDFLGRWILAPLVFTDFDAYRERHWDHHRYLGSDRDTKDAYLSDVTGWGVLKLLLDCMLLRVAFGKLRLQSSGESGGSLRPALLRVLLAQALFFAALLAAAKGLSGGDLVWLFPRTVLFYGFVFGYGLASLSPFVASLRTIAEHQPGADGAPVEGRAALRNFRCGPIGRLIFGAYGFADHATHHLHPAVPSYRLPAVSARSDRKSFIRRGSYFSTLAMLVRRHSDPSHAPSHP